MEFDRRGIITESVAPDKMFALRPIIEMQQALKEAKLTSAGLNQKKAINREYLETTQIRLYSEINNQLESIENEYETALEMGANPSEATLRKKVQTSHLALGVLLTRKNNPTLFPGFKVKIYTHPQDNGIFTPVSRNKIEIMVPNPNQDQPPTVISTKLNTLTNAMKTTTNNPGINSKDILKNLISPQIRETETETDDEFINRRFIELDKLRIFIKKGHFNDEQDLQNKNYRSALAGQLLRIWLQRRGSSVNYESVLQVGYLFNDVYGDKIELRLSSSSTDNFVRMPTVDRWYSTESQRKLISLLAANGVDNPSDYDFLANNY